jgi:hypothetical protein
MQAVVARASVVDRDLETLAVVMQQGPLEEVEVGDRLLFGDLEDDALAGQMVLLEDVVAQAALPRRAG